MHRMRWFILSVTGFFGVWTATVGPVMAQTATSTPSVVPVRLTDLIRSALQKNLDLQLARLQPEFAEATVYQESAPFQPQLSANFLADSAQNPSASVLAGAPVIEQRRTNVSLGFSQRIAWGTQITIGLNQNRTSTNSIFASLNPQYNSGLSIQVTQPLLRGFGPWNAQASLRAAEKRHQQSLQAFEEAQMDLLLQVVQAYWDLVFAQKNLEVQKNSLALAEKLLRDTEVQIEVGVKAPIERTAAQAEVAARRQNVVTATNLLQAATDRLKALVEAIEGLMHRPGEIWQPMDEPPVPTPPDTLETYIEAAFRERPQLVAVQAQLDAAQYQYRAALNQRLPQLNLVASYSWAGLGGDQRILDLSRGITNATVLRVIPGSALDSLHQVLAGKYPTWSIGFQLAWPLRDSATRGLLLLTEAQLQTARIELERQRQNIVLQVRNAYRDLIAAQQSYEAAQASVRLQREKVEAEQKKLELGLSTNFIVLQYQNDLAVAEQQLLQAQVSYAKAWAQLQRAIGRFRPEQVLQMYANLRTVGE